ncbi:MAG: hypothetical protein ACREB3_11105 [Burkholderiales bacterium]
MTAPRYWLEWQGRVVMNRSDTGATVPPMLFNHQSKQPEGNLHEVSRKVSAWTRRPDPARLKKLS